ncbi:MAG: redoxin domain-containing protein [Planctomycetota bacterium]
MKSTPYWQHGQRLTVLTFILLSIQIGACSKRTRASGQRELPDGFKELKTGDKAPDFELPGVDGKTYNLGDFAEPDVLMVYFTGTHCPTSHGVEKRLQSFIKEMEGSSFGIVAINPNHSSGLRPDEFAHTKYDETFEDSRRYAKDLGWTFPFLYDGDKQLTARAYGCLATPHVFVFDKHRTLRYNGRFDDSRLPNPKTIKNSDAINAVKALLAGKPVPVEKTRPHGCSTKWRERSKHVAEDEAKWQAAVTTIEEIDLQTVRKLRENGSGKIRLFNVWATWCAPCVEEMPDLTKIARRFSRREFELITISLDSIEDKEKAATFLGKVRAVMSDQLRATVEAEGRKTNNYIYTGDSTDDLAEALDPKWPGPAPYSLLIDKDGNVLYREVGIVNAEKVSAIILETLTQYHSTDLPRSRAKSPKPNKAQSKN